MEWSETIGRCCLYVLSNVAWEVVQLSNTEECALGMAMVRPSGVMIPFLAKFMVLATDVMKSA